MELQFTRGDILNKYTYWQQCNLLYVLWQENLTCLKKYNKETDLGLEKRIKMVKAKAFKLKPEEWVKVY